MKMKSTKNHRAHKKTQKKLAKLMTGLEKKASKPQVGAWGSCSRWIYCI